MIARLILILGLALTGAGMWQREEITRLRAVLTLFDEDRIVANFSGMDGLFLSRPMSRGDGPASALPTAATPLALPAGFDEWIEARAVTAVVVLKDGRITYERYFLGTDEDDLRISWSLAKSFVSALVGILVDEGTIGSLDGTVNGYAPVLNGSAYEGVTIRQVLTMSSGVEFNEDYLDFWSDINRMGRVLALGRSMDGFTAYQTGRAGPPGETWRYVSIDTHVLAMVARAAAKRSLPELMEEKIFRPLGLEADPYFLVDGEGAAFALGGLNLRTRDYARFGQMFLQDGRMNGAQIVPAAWVAASTVPSAPTAPGATQYGLQWWIAPDAGPGEFYARGVYGQYIYINRALGTVIAVNSADRRFREPGVNAGNIAMFRAIAEEMR